MKRNMFILIFVTVLITFMWSLNQSRKGLSISRYDSNYPTGLNEVIKINDRIKANESIIDDFISILINSTDIGTIYDVGNVDYSYRLFSIRQHYTIKYGDILLNEDGTAILGNYNTETNQLENAKQISLENTATLKQILKID